MGKKTLKRHPPNKTRTSIKITQKQTTLSPTGRKGCLFAQEPCSFDYLLL